MGVEAPTERVGPANPKGEPVTATLLYRWECRDCRKRGRWLKDPGVAQHYAWQHADRTATALRPDGHRSRLLDNTGRDYGPAV